MLPREVATLFNRSLDSRRRYVFAEIACRSLRSCPISLVAFRRPSTTSKQICESAGDRR
jgi:hypothetical protein